MKQDNDALKRIIARFEGKWQAQAQEAIKKFNDLVINRGIRVEDALRLLRNEYPRVFRFQDLESALIEAAAYGYGVMPSILTSADKAAMYKVLDKPWSADGMRLSEKLHNGGEAMLKAIQDTVQAQIRKNATATQIARELYDGYNSGKAVTQQHDMAQYMRKIEMLQGESRDSNSLLRQAERNINRLGRNGAPNQALKAAYNKLLKAVEDGNEKALKNATKVAIEEKSRYIADRIARTEMARAYADGFFSKHQDNPNVVAYQFKLSTRHPAFDVCNMYADGNMFNLGVGVYPKDQVPLVPIHPHCLCKYKAIYKSQIDISKQKDRRNSEMVHWVNKLPEIQAKSVLGVRGYTAYKAAKTAYNERKSKTSSNISIKDLASLITQNMRGFVPLQHPRYREINLIEANKTSQKVKAKERITKILDTPKITIASPIASSIPGKGTPQGMLAFNAPMTRQQKNALSRLQNFGDYIIINKKELGMRDLAVLTLVTGDEFAMFTRGSTRLVMRGDVKSVPINPLDAAELKKRGYKWSGHTHRGDSPFYLVASSGDKDVLKAFGQEQCIIYNAKGQFALFNEYA